MLVACSGGVDSMVLCELLKHHSYHFAIAHCNFGLRGADSDSDEALVKQYGLQNGITTHVTHFDTQAFAEENKLSIQVAARELRYQWFFDLMKEFRYDYLLTAHHADDNAETVLINLFKGTGIHGLTGIAAKRDQIVRPLLFASKNEIVAYAKANAISWREDASNASDKYTRNFFRNRIIPQIEEVVPGASVNVNETIQHLKEAELLYQQAVAMHRKELMVQKQEEVHIPILKFAAAVPFDTIAWELLKPFGFTPPSMKDVKQLLQAETGRYLSSATHRIIKNRKWLIIAPIGAGTVDNIVIDEADKRVVFAGETLEIKRSNAKDISKYADIASLDASKLSFPLLLRKWKTGDYFYPLGMPKKKKVARFFIDQKLSQTQKEKAWVLVSNNKIVWVMGYRIDDRFKITSTTKEVYTITRKTG